MNCSYWKDVDRNTAFDHLAKGGKARPHGWSTNYYQADGRSMLTQCYVGSISSCTLALIHLQPDSKWQIWAEPLSDKERLDRLYEQVTLQQHGFDNNLPKVLEDERQIRGEK